MVCVSLIFPLKNISQIDPPDTNSIQVVVVQGNSIQAHHFVQKAHISQLEISPQTVSASSRD